MYSKKVVHWIVMVVMAPYLKIKARIQVDVLELIPPQNELIINRVQRRVHMEKKLGVIAFCLLAIFVVFYRPLPAAACSCMVLPPADIALSEATAVFSGEVMTIEKGKGVDGESGKTVRFKVAEVWKGVDNADISVFTGNDSAGCGIDFTIGKEYLVYAHNWDMDGKSVLSTTLCDRTAELTNATDDITLNWSRHSS